MVESKPTRRRFLAATGVVALAGAGVVNAHDDSSSASHDTFTIMTGTSSETTVHVLTGEADGPTAMVVGGMHGDEAAGYMAAEEIAKWDIESGRLVVIPKANVRAIERGTRTAADGVDLNRQFPTGSEPGYDLARAIWDVAVEYEPDVVVDMHESYKLYNGDATDGVGQAVFRSHDLEAAAKAGQAVRYVNDEYVESSTNEFEIGYFSGPEVRPNGLFAHKVVRDLDGSSFLVETLSSGPELETRIQWHDAVARQLTEDELFDGDAGETQPPTEVPEEPKDNETAPEGEDDIPTEDETDEPEPNSGPSAAIETTPSDAESLDLTRGDTVTFDAATSTDADGEVVSYEWDLDGDGTFEASGETTELTLDECGDYPVTLRVTDDDGASDTATLTVSTKAE